MARVSFDVLSARHAYKAEEWFKFGADVGRMLAFLTQPIDDDTLKVLLNQE